MNNNERGGKDFIVLVSIVLAVAAWSCFVGFQEGRAQTVETGGKVVTTTLEWTGAVQHIHWTGPRKVGRQKITIMTPTDIFLNEAEGGTVTLTVANTNVGAFTVQATPAPGYVFRGWKGDVGGDGETTTIVARRQQYVTPVFEKEK